MGVGNDRLKETLKRSRGLTPDSRDGRTLKIPPHNFPQGKWFTGKTPRVTKDKVKHLHHAAIAEVCFTDTFEVNDKLIDMDRLLFVIACAMETSYRLNHGLK